MKTNTTHEHKYKEVHLEDTCTALQYTYFNYQPDEASSSLFADDNVLQSDF